MEVDFDGLMRTFLGECEESLHAMEQALLALESRPEDEEPVQTLFRMAHSLKGNSMSLGFPDLAEFTHALEEVLDRLRSRQMPVTSDVVSDLLSSVDALREMIPAAVAAARDRAAVTDAPLAPAPAGDAWQTRTLRVDVESLDRLPDLTGEMAVARGQLRQVLERTGDAEALEAHREADRLPADLQELAMRV